MDNTTTGVCHYGQNLLYPGLLAGTDTTLQLFGWKGLSRECLIEKLYRDARASLIEDGVNDVLALVGARRLLAGLA